MAAGELQPVDDVDLQQERRQDDRGGEQPAAHVRASRSESARPECRPGVEGLTLAPGDGLPLGVPDGVGLGVGLGGSSESRFTVRVWSTTTADEVERGEVDVRRHDAGAVELARVGSIRLIRPIGTSATNGGRPPSRS